jgi:hypothetical protein
VTAGFDHEVVGLDAKMAALSLRGGGRRLKFGEV